MFVGAWPCYLLSSLISIGVHTAFAQIPQYEGDNLRIATISWDYTDDGVGPNGPWHVIPVNTGGNFESNTTFYALPSLSDTNIVVDRTAYDPELDDAKFSNDWPDDWGVLGALSNGWGTILDKDYNIVESESNVEHFTASGGEAHQYDGFAYDIAEHLGVQYHTMPFQQVYNQTRPFQRIIASRNLTLQAPWGNGERIISSFLSLNASRNVSNILSYSDNISFLNPACDSSPSPMCDRYADRNISGATYNPTLSSFVTDEVAASRSFALQIGSVAPFIQPTLLIGGYDANLFLTEPALIDLSKPDGVFLHSLRLSVKSGDIAFRHPEDFESGSGQWLRDPIIWKTPATDSPWTVQFDPSLPYMYLPRNACDRLTKYLPVTYDSDLQLYLWDAKNSSNNYTQILTSPHFVDFVLYSASPDAVDTTISVPLALLNLTLTAPILNGSDGDTSKQYFPCRPLDISTNTAVLGRAFLQAAYLAVNWENGMMAVGQAPGPDHRTRASNTIEGLRMIRGGNWDTFGVGKAPLVNLTGESEAVLVDSWRSLLTPLGNETTDVKKSDGMGLRLRKEGFGLLLGGVAGVLML